MLHFSYRCDPTTNSHSSSSMSLFAQTTKEQDDIFYATFPDACPPNYQFGPNANSASSPQITYLTESRLGTAFAQYTTTTHGHSFPSVHSLLSPATSLSRHSPVHITSSPNISNPALSASPSPLTSPQSFSGHDLQTQSGSLTDHPTRLQSPATIQNPKRTPRPGVDDEPATHRVETESPGGRVVYLEVTENNSWHSRPHLPIPTPSLSIDTKMEYSAYATPPDSRLEDSPFTPTELLPFESPSPPTPKKPSPITSPFDKVSKSKVSSTKPSGRRVGGKKPTLACIFCRGRKIACGPPLPGGPEHSCNQCQRRSLKCEFPRESRRGARKLMKSSKASSRARMDDKS